MSIAEEIQHLAYLEMDRFRLPEKCFIGINKYTELLREFSPSRGNFTSFLTYTN